MIKRSFGSMDSTMPIRPAAQRHFGGTIAWSANFAWRSVRPRDTVLAAKMETTVLPTHRPSLVDDEIDDSSTVVCDDVDDAKNNTLNNGIDKFLCHVDRVVDPIIDSGDAMLQTNSFYDFFFGWLGSSSGSDSCRCWDDESTIFTAWTEYSACTGYSACTDYSACTGYSACTDYASAVTFICVGEDEKWSDVNNCANNDDTFEDDDSLSVVTNPTSVSHNKASADTPSKSKLRNVIWGNMRKDSSSSKEKEGKDKAKASSDRFMNHIPFTTEHFKEVCASNTRPIRFVAIRPGGDIVQDTVIIPITIDQPGPLGLAIKTDTDGAVLVKQVPTSAMEACKQLRPGDILAHPAADDFPTPVPESENSSIKHPTIEIVYKGLNSETQPQKQEGKATLLIGDTSKKANSKLHRSLTSPMKVSLPPSEIDVGGNTLDASLTTKNIEDTSPSSEPSSEPSLSPSSEPSVGPTLGPAVQQSDATTVKPKDEGIDTKKSAEELKVSPAVVPTSGARDECAESLCSIPRIEPVATSSIKNSTQNPSRNWKTKTPPTMSTKIHQQIGRPNGQSKSHVIKSRVVPFNSKQPGIEEEYFKDVATKHSEESANPSALIGVLPRLEGTRLIRLPNIFPSTDEAKHIDADVTKPSAEEATTREPPDAGQKSDIDKALVLATNDTKAAPSADAPFGGMGVLASHFLSNLQKNKDKTAEMKAMFNVLAEEKRQDLNIESTDYILRENHEPPPTNSIGSPVCSYNADDDRRVPEDNAVKSIDSASTCIRYSVKVSKGMKKSRTHRRKKKVPQGRR